VIEVSTTFSDYVFYTQNGGQLSEAEYSAVVGAAYAEIISQTSGRALTSDAIMDAVKRCECALVDVIAAYRKGAALLPKGVGSISNDGYSVSMGSTSPVQAEAQERRTICARYLQTPVNLMCRWI
jgi:hypothetical protein